MPILPSRSRQSSVVDTTAEAPTMDAQQSTRKSFSNIFGGGARRESTEARPISSTAPRSDAAAATDVAAPSKSRRPSEAGTPGEATSSATAPTATQGSANPDFTPVAGHEGNLTDEQKKVLDKFREELYAKNALEKNNAPHYQTTQLLRFLRARNFDVAKSLEMYLSAEKYKEDIELDRLCEEFEFTERAQVAEYGWRMYFHKTDKLGRPIFIQDLSGLDTDKVFSVTTNERIIQNFSVTLEKAVRMRYLACTEAQGHLVDDNFMVLNVQGLGLGTFWAMKNRLQQLLNLLDNNFPELSGRVQIINAPMLFTTIWSYVKGWLPAHTAEKIDICGSNYLPLIKTFVDMDNWPKHLGGNCTCNAKEKTHLACETCDPGPWKNSSAAAGL